MEQQELARERAYVAQVQQLLYEVIRRAEGSVSLQDETIRMMISDAWDELRLKPTALSPWDLEQLSAEIDRYQARADFSRERMARAEQMLLKPFFDRVDFQENGANQSEKIVIGLYSLSAPGGELLVHDWRAPVSSLYYDAMPGPAEYDCPQGKIVGTMTLKRQYRFENGRLQYYVDTDVSIDDQMLLDLLSASSTGPMQQIVSTIQKEQNAAIRHENVHLLSVCGGAGCGKTSVAMHRAAYLMYRYRESLDARRIVILSPSDAFSEYISSVLPSLGEENAKTLTLYRIVRKLLARKMETPFAQQEKLLRDRDALRMESIEYKSRPEFIAFLDGFAARYTQMGPAFEDLADKHGVLASREELIRLYTQEFTLLNPAYRLMRMRKTMESRLDDRAKSLSDRYEQKLMDRYRGKELEAATRMAAVQHLHPLRSQVNRALKIDPLRLYAECMKDAPDALARAARENAEAGLLWWEDAVPASYLWLKLGFVGTDETIRHLLIDEAQDYTPLEMRFLHRLYPQAHATLLGDPRQRTAVALKDCAPERWGEWFDEPAAPMVRLNRCYRSTRQITLFCNGLIQSDEIEPLGRDGEAVYSGPFSEDALKDFLSAHAHGSLAVVTPSHRMAQLLSKRLAGSILLEPDEDAVPHERGKVVVSCLQLMKGLEFDAVAVVWDKPTDAPSERRRLYTACSRALHALALFISPASLS